MLATRALAPGVAAAGPPAAAAAPASEQRPVRSAETVFSAEVDVFLLSGRYGEEERTEILYAPIILRAAGPRATFSFTLPYLRVEGPATIAAGEAGGVPSGGAGAGADRARSGIGDVLLRGELFLLQGDGRKKPWVSALGRLKVPTASREEGLGTGEYDVTAGVSVTQPFGGRFAGFLDLLHRRTGDPPGERLEDTRGFVAGVSVVAARPLTVYLSYDREEALLAVLEGGESLSAGFVARPRRDWRLSGAAFFGLSETREDFGAMVGLARVWPAS